MPNFVALNMKGFGEMLAMGPRLDQKYIAVDGEIDTAIDMGIERQRYRYIDRVFCSQAPEASSQLNRKSVSCTIFV